MPDALGRPTLLSQSTSYAILAVSCLEGPAGSYRLVRQVAEQAKIPAAYLAKIFNLLRRRGLVEAQRGVGGGVRLRADPREMTLYDVCAAMDDPLLERRCLLGLSACSDEHACPGHDFWTAQQDEIMRVFRSIALPAMSQSLAMKGTFRKDR